MILYPPTAAALVAVTFVWKPPPINPVSPDKLLSLLPNIPPLAPAEVILLLLPPTIAEFWEPFVLSLPPATIE